MSTGHADSARAALSVAEARVQATVADAGEVVWALGVQLAITTFARHESISDVSSRAGTDWTLSSSAVVARCALSVSTARVRLTEVTGFERSAVGEGISSHVSGAGTDGCKTTEVAFGVSSTGVDTGVDTCVVDTGGLVTGALAV